MVDAPTLDYEMYQALVPFEGEYVMVSFQSSRKNLPSHRVAGTIQCLYPHGILVEASWRVFVSFTDLYCGHVMLSGEPGRAVRAVLSGTDKQAIRRIAMSIDQELAMISGIAV